MNIYAGDVDGCFDVRSLNEINANVKSNWKKRFNSNSNLVIKPAYIVYAQ